MYSVEVGVGELGLMGVRMQLEKVVYVFVQGAAPPISNPVLANQGRLHRAKVGHISSYHTVGPNANVSQAANKL